MNWIIYQKYINVKQLKNNFKFFSLLAHDDSNIKHFEKKKHLAHDDAKSKYLEKKSKQSKQKSSSKEKKFSPLKSSFSSTASCPI